MTEKRKCAYYRTGSGPIIFESTACERQRETGKLSCENCPFITPAAPPATAPAMPVPGPGKEKAMNTMNDLHNELFLQLRRLNAKDLKGEDMKNEIERSRAVTGLSHAIIANAGLVLKAHLGVANSVGTVHMPALISGNEESFEGE